MILWAPGAQGPSTADCMNRDRLRFAGDDTSAGPHVREDARRVGEGAVVLGPGYYAGGAESLARDMVGKVLCRGSPDGVRRYRITETEAYVGEGDTACHAHRCPTGRARVMYFPGGVAYVHRCHMYNLLTVVVGPEGSPEGVLIRGVEGFDGPGRVGRELGLELTMGGSPMSPEGHLWLEDDGARPDVTSHERIGIPYASEEDRARLWRFRASRRRCLIIRGRFGVQMPEATVGEYMVRNVHTITPDMTVEQVRQQIINSNFHGFPIVEKGYLLGFVTAKELLKYIDKPDAKIRTVMKRGTLCAIPSMSIDDATRILFRYGLRNLPVVDEDRKIVGIISNIDIVRSQIEKSRPGKVMSVKNFLEQQNGVRMKVANRDIPVSEIIPTQKEVYMDELIGRQYELKRGLNEPLIVVERRNGYLLVDGHHRIMAAHRMGMKTFKAIVLVPNDLDVKFGLEKTAERWGLKKLDDVSIIEGSKHPFMEVTTMLLPSEEADGINQRLMDSVKE